MDTAADSNTQRSIPGHMRKPVIALMGEFSAGKSTLTNLLVGAPALPVQVTATQLPPVWISHGDGKPMREDLSGAKHPADLSHIDDVPLNETLCIRAYQPAEILTCCDLIDMPGISDPNMSSEVWQRVLPHADAVIWCTHATQAWRQSEAAVWEMVPRNLQKKSLLLMTRFDKVHKSEDRDRLVRRIRKETNGLFYNVYPISLTDAINAGDDRAAWEASGAEEFVQALIDLIHALGSQIGSRIERPVPEPTTQRTEGDHVADRFRAREVERNKVVHLSEKIAPRRVAPMRPVTTGSGRRIRPEPGAGH